MKIGIIGLPSSGKTTVFNAVSGGHAEVHSFSATTQADPNIAVVSVPDLRQDWLTQLYKPKKTTHATVELVDVAGFLPGQAKKDGFSPQLLAHLRQVDALVCVVRAFDNPAVPHPSGSIDPKRDIELGELELIIADLSVVEKRLLKLEQEIQRKKGQERTIVEAEKELLAKFKEKLSDEIPLRQIAISEEEAKLISGYTFLSMKPLLVVANIEEKDINKQDTCVTTAFKEFCRQHAAPLITFCAKIEMEIAQLDETERGEFMQALGVQESSRDKLIKAAYELLNLISFFTVGEDEVKAWTLTQGKWAQEAARKIHSDIARGFIRAEVVSFAAIKQHGSWHAAKEKGAVRLEGKEYLVHDGDCINFRFAV